MNITGYRPRNEFLQRQLDASWRRWVTIALLMAGGAALVLGALAGPRQTAVRLRYEIVRLTQEVDRLERDFRRLEIEREQLTSPALLSRELSELDLQRVHGDRVAFLAEDGRLLWQPSAGQDAQPDRGRVRP